MTDKEIIERALEIVKDFEDSSGGFLDTIDALEYMIEKGIWCD